MGWVARNGIQLGLSSSQQMIGLKRWKKRLRSCKVLLCCGTAVLTLPCHTVNSCSKHSVSRMAASAKNVLSKCGEHNWHLCPQPSPWPPPALPSVCSALGCLPACTYPAVPAPFRALPFPSLPSCLSCTPGFLHSLPHRWRWLGQETEGREGGPNG